MGLQDDGLLWGRGEPGNVVSYFVCLDLDADEMFDERGIRGVGGIFQSAIWEDVLEELEDAWEAAALGGWLWGSKEGNHVCLAGRIIFGQEDSDAVRSGQPVQVEFDWGESVFS